MLLLLVMPLCFSPFASSRLRLAKRRSRESRKEMVSARYFFFPPWVFQRGRDGLV
jgi:hypothetical protein